ncbi:protein polybromo-1 [Trichonephila inaurata madagascariensis]|uniref:Protein polybromo-1 n=1 Tax=Trichonephila inaurata madagascariensis TaxID=2747483 RepID=A0A8X7C973_9ARAC|nr:protein polybromo-1 [Trichonephila inaurata madagascariensis]
MPKRKKISITSEEGSKDGSESSKRRKSELDPVEVCHELYETIRNHRTEDGHLLCESFIRAPNRRSLADYYDIITTPIDLLKIQQKLKTEEYVDVNQFSADIELMVNNAKSYYKKNTPEYRDACDLWDVFVDAKADILSGDGRKDEDKSSEIDDDRGSECSEEESAYEELFTTVMTAADMEGRALSTMFQLLPSRTLYPEYYKVIQEPIDLKMIAQKIVNNEYRSLCEMEKNLLQMIKNAKIFNEPGSQIYKDAATLRKIILIKKAEIDQRKTYPAKSSERIRNKRLAGGQKWSSIIAALKYDAVPKVDLTSEAASPASVVELADESVDAEDESDPEDAHTNPQWMLYETVKNYINTQGYQLSEPFWTLPSRRSYPDYYKEIKQPMSLFKIRTKIKSGHFTSLVDVVDDMNLMFENAKKYNRPDSKLFKDAVKLQKIMQAKARELINQHMKDSESDEDEDRASKRKAKKLVLTPLPEIKKQRRSLDGDTSIKKKARSLYKAIHDYVDDDGRPLISVFMEKPSKKDYPDYYEIISNPIDMKTIDSNIKADKYMNEESLLADFRLMFANCKHYNEEGSQIYQDAETLESVLNNKIQEMGLTQCDTPKIRVPIKRVIKDFAKEELHKNTGLTGMKQKLKTFYDTVKEYTDNRGRKLSVIFNKLPSKTDYPDYYEVIKRPIDLDKIGAKLKSGQYETLEDMLSDFVLMFDNACKYNEPDSQIYKDALTMQRMTLQTKLELNEDTNNGVPDVRALVQELLTDLFISTYNHQDEEGRCFSDSLVEFSETDATSTDPAKKVLNLDMIKRNLDKGKYKRLDRFQEDMFDVFELVRHNSRTDSQVFEDSVELQSFFIKRRDVLCKNGEVLLSPALQYTEADLQASVETLRAQKLPREQQEAELEPKQEKEETRTNEISSSDSATFQTETYYVGDFVYIEPREKGMEPHIMHVEKLWRDNLGEQWLYGCWFYRPNETFHLATRKFLEKEVFKSDNYNSTPLNQVIGKCYVMFVKDYFKLRPLEFEFKDVYVCESRYSAKAKAFKKIKIWNFTANNHVHIVTREEQVDPIRVPSVFKDGFEKPKDEKDDDEPDLDVVVKPRPNLVCEVQSPEEGATYYEQYTIPSGTYKLGDCCYVRTEHNKSLIGRIDKMWIDKMGNAFYHGPWFVTPQEVQHPPTRLFFRQEVFLSSIEDTNPLLSVIGHCAVLEFKDYCTKRPTEIPEQDIFICESRYLEAERQIRRLSKGLRKIPLTSNVTEDEYYFFRKPINPQKTEVIALPAIPKKIMAPSPSELSPLMTRPTMETDNEESNDVSTPMTVSEQDVATPILSSVKKKNSKRIVTGYILFASEVRRSVIAANPDRSFGDISRLIGTEWRNLPVSKKADYEERAQKQNEETQAQLLNESSLPHSPASTQGSERTENVIYECMWDGCDHQFEDQTDLIDHLAAEPSGHIQQTYKTKGVEKSEIQCLWYNCQRIKKNIPPFPNVARLIRHVKEVHLKTSAKNVLPENRNRNFTPSKRNAATNMLTATSNSNFPTTFKNAPFNGGPPSSPFLPGISYPFGGVATPRPGQSSMPHPTKALEPLFVSTPPRTQRLLHSNVYIKYIEGLQAESKYISNWDAHLKATPETTVVPDPQRLPTHWLGNSYENHGSALNALWALRNFMLKDALNISKIL